MFRERAPCAPHFFQLCVVLCEAMFCCHIFTLAGSGLLGGVLLGGISLVWIRWEVQVQICVGFLDNLPDSLSE